MAAAAAAPTGLNVFPPPPPGLNYIAAIQPSVTFLMIGTVFSGILLPLLVALFHFSTKHTRRQPIFILNVICITLGLTLGIYNAYIEVTALLSPSRPFWRYHDLVFSLMLTFVAWLVEMILLLRLLAVYPYSSTSKRIWFTIFIPLILLKLARIINTSIFNADYNRQLRLHPYYSPLASSQTVWRTYPNSKIEWILQVIDNSATSILFIMRLRGRLNVPERKDSRRNGNSYAAQLKTLFWIAVSNFVFPVILSIIQLILLFHDPNYLKGSYVFMANDYVEIIGVLLATVWTTSNQWTEKNTVYPDTSVKTAPRFASNYQLRSGTTESGITRGEFSEAERGDLESHPDYFAAQDKGRIVHVE